MRTDAPDGDAEEVTAATGVGVRRASDGGISQAVLRHTADVASVEVVAVGVGDCHEVGPPHREVAPIKLDGFPRRLSIQCHLGIPASWCICCYRRTVTTMGAKERSYHGVEDVRRAALAGEAERTIKDGGRLEAKARVDGGSCESVEKNKRH